MDQYHRDIVHKKVLEAARLIDGRLPEHPLHPKGRIPVAHIYQVIQTVLGRPVKSCGNDRLNDILSIINDCVEHVEISEISAMIKTKYQSYPSQTTSNLDAFFE